MTEAETKLIEAALHWRHIHGPATPMTSSAMTDVAHACEEVIRERNRAARDDRPAETIIREIRDTEWKD